MNKLKREGAKLRQRARDLRTVGITDSHICVVGRFSTSSLHKIFRDDPTVLPNTYSRAVEAIEKLEQEAQASA